MKDLRLIHTSDEFDMFLSSLWKTEEFKKSFYSNDYIRKICDLYKSKPRYIARYSDPKLEHAHFYSWFNILILRDDYQNPIIHDLYVLHELYHISTMKYNPELSYENWKQKMIDNEMIASLNSEVWVYKKIPIRSKSFDFKIWFDELSSKDLKNMDRLWKKRKQALSSPKTSIEITLSKYKESNEEWSKIWKDKYIEVESLMRAFYEEKDIMKADNNFRNFLKSKAINEIPYYNQAVEFYMVYSKLKSN